jgi:hypothetical protein
MYRVVVFCAILVAGVVLQRPQEEFSTYMYTGFCDGREYQEHVYPICLDKGVPAHSCKIFNHYFNKLECDVLECYDVQWTNVQHCHMFLWKWRCANETARENLTVIERAVQGFAQIVEL